MGHIFAHTVARKAHKSGFLDIRQGFQLFRSREVSAIQKLGALGIGGFLTALLMLFEVPLESIVGVLLPFLGVALDMAIDGAEVILLPMLIGAAVLPHLVRRTSTLTRPLLTKD